MCHLLPVVLALEVVLGVWVLVTELDAVVELEVPVDVGLDAQKPSYTSGQF